MISDYFKEIERIIEEAKIIAEREIDYKEFSSDEGMIRGKLLFINGYVLEFMEYVSIGEERPKYRFHLMDKDGEMIFRYDNAPHHEISTFPHHKHLPEGIKESKEKGINEVLKFRKSRCWLWVYVEKMHGIVKKMDFTLSRYKELCLALLDSGYTPLTVYSYLVLGGQKKKNNNNNNKLVVLRHDIDRKPENALRMAVLEHELGIQST